MSPEGPATGAGASVPPEEDPGVGERHLEVVRTARYARLGPADGTAAEVWIVVHGYRQLARRFLRRFRPLDDGTRLILAPEGLSRFYLDDDGGRHGPEHRVGASWMTREDREAEIRDYVRYLDRLAGTAVEGRDRSAVRIRALGFSQGVHTACRWAVLGARPPDQLVLWGAYLPPDLEAGAAEGRLSEMDLLLVRGRDDRHADPGRARDEARRLEEWGVPYRTLEYDGGHRIVEEALLRVARS